MVNGRLSPPILYCIPSARACPAERTTSAQSRHLGVRAGFVDENQPVRIKRRLRLFPFFARLGHVFPVLLAGVQRFFTTDAVTLEKPRNRTVRRLELTLGKKPRLYLGQRQVRRAGDQSQQPIRMVVQRRRSQFFARLFGETARRLEALPPFDRRRCRNRQLPSCGPPENATFNQRNRRGGRPPWPDPSAAQFMSGRRSSPASKRRSPRSRAAIAGRIPGRLRIGALRNDISIVWLLTLRNI